MGVVAAGASAGRPVAATGLAVGAGGEVAAVAVLVDAEAAEDAVWRDVAVLHVGGTTAVAGGTADAGPCVLRALEAAGGVSVATVAATEELGARTRVGAGRAGKDEGDQSRARGR